jgi:hypothetical protein
VRINLGTLRRKMSQEEGTELSEAQIQHWLIDAGFERTDQEWIVKEEDLGHLDPSEVSSVEPVE